MAQLTDVQIASFAAGAGFTGQARVIAVAVALAESAGRTDATNVAGNHPPSTDRGLWQINSYWHPEVTDAAAFDPARCAAAAYRISDGGATWAQWSTYNSGSYKQFLVRAQRAVSLLAGSVFVLRRLIGLPSKPGIAYLRGADVLVVQQLVGITGPANDPNGHGLDSICGPYTVAHIKAWQTAHGLTPDGVFGPACCHAAGWTWAG